MGGGPSIEQKKAEAKWKVEKEEAKRQAALDKEKRQAALDKEKRKAELAKKVVPIKQNNQWERLGERLNDKKNENEVKVYKGKLQGSEKIVVMKMVNHKQCSQE